MNDQGHEVSEPEVGAETAPAGTEAAPAEDELMRLRREAEELRDQNLRLTAELQNQHKRAQREKSEALRYAEFEFAKDLLVVVDDLERTRASANSAADAQAVADGVRIIYDHLLKVLRSHDIEPVEAVGRTFDPTYHEALMQQPDPDQPAGTVLRELSRGYTMHDRVLRPSRVIVASAAAPGQVGTEDPEPSSTEDE